jgi:hypothetical protein
MAPRVATAVAALAGAGCLGALSTISATDSASVASAAGNSGWLLAGLLAAAGTALLALALGVAGPRLVAPALALLGAAWLLGIPGSGGLRPLTPLAAGWLLATGELAYWSLELTLPGRDAPEVGLRRAAMIAALVGVAMVPAAVAEFGFSPAPSAGVALTVAGLLAAIALVATAAALTWRVRGSRD